MGLRIARIAIAKAHSTLLILATPAVLEPLGAGNGVYLSYYPSSSAFTTVGSFSLLSNVGEVYIDLILSGGVNHAVDNIVLVPEPTTALLLALGLVGLSMRRRVAI